MSPPTRWAAERSDGPRRSFTPRLPPAPGPVPCRPPRGQAEQRWVVNPGRKGGNVQNCKQANKHKISYRKPLANIQAEIENMLHS